MINSQNFMTEPKEREYVKTILRLWLWENSDTYYNQNEKKKKVNLLKFPEKELCVFHLQHINYS